MVGPLHCCFPMPRCFQFTVRRANIVQKCCLMSRKYRHICCVSNTRQSDHEVERSTSSRPLFSWTVEWNWASSSHTISPTDYRCQSRRAWVVNSSTSVSIRANLQMSSVERNIAGECRFGGPVPYRPFLRSLFTSTLSIDSFTGFRVHVLSAGLAVCFMYQRNYINELFRKSN